MNYIEELDRYAHQEISSSREHQKHSETKRHTIERNGVELLVGNGSITDAGKVNNGCAGRLAVLVIHQRALLEGSHSGGEDEL